MGQLRSALRAHILDGATPAQALERLNRFLLSLSWDSMATACVLLLEPATGALTFANAGHPPPLLLDPDGVAHTLKESLAVPLGALDVVGYDEGSAVLEPGATLSSPGYCRACITDQAETLAAISKRGFVAG